MPDSPVHRNRYACRLERMEVASFLKLLSVDVAVGAVAQGPLRRALPQVGRVETAVGELLAINCRGGPIWAVIGFCVPGGKNEI